ncbi:hypothetical protein ASZ90_002278 [hydrocarbon metagenome]|uniref:Uncharacterized protein n=1 Tax=hydrocarbon metagenome TaxID=938273 RepID=A0A0W8G4G8_9ZZZZ
MAAQGLHALSGQTQRRAAPPGGRPHRVPHGAGGVRRRDRQVRGSRGQGLMRLLRHHPGPYRGPGRGRGRTSLAAPRGRRGLHGRHLPGLHRGRGRGTPPGGHRRAHQSHGQARAHGRAAKRRAGRGRAPRRRADRIRRGHPGRQCGRAPGGRGRGLAPAGARPHRPHERPPVPGLQRYRGPDRRIVDLSGLAPGQFHKRRTRPHGGPGPAVPAVWRAVHPFAPGGPQTPGHGRRAAGHRGAAGGQGAWHGHPQASDHGGRPGPDRVLQARGGPGLLRDHPALPRGLGPAHLPRPVQHLLRPAGPGTGQLHLSGHVHGKRPGGGHRQSQFRAAAGDGLRRRGAP